MKNVLSIALLLALIVNLSAQNYDYEPSEENPFGLLNPDAPKETADFAPYIGLCKCKSVSRIDQNTWADTVSMYWSFKYIMNGMAVQDETLKEDGVHSGSIRQFNSDSSKWYVHWYATNSLTPTLSTWEGGKTDDGKIILFRDFPAPNGTPGDYRLTFYPAGQKGFNWAGEWVTKGETFVYPSWRIFCEKM